VVGVAVVVVVGVGVGVAVVVVVGVVGERQIRYVPAAAPLSEETGAEARDGTDDDG
jgi:hypothetical protein